MVIADGGLTAGVMASTGRGVTRSTCTGGRLDTTAGCDRTTSGDDGRVVEMMLARDGSSRW